jgi:hypothetical protein
MAVDAGDELIFPDHFVGKSLQEVFRPYLEQVRIAVETGQDAMQAYGASQQPTRQPRPEAAFRIRPPLEDAARDEPAGDDGPTAGRPTGTRTPGVPGSSETPDETTAPDDSEDTGTPDEPESPSSSPTRSPSPTPTPTPSPTPTPTPTESPDDQLCVDLAIVKLCLG